MYKNKKIIAVIPARGGSKGIPKKNLKLLAGKPLITYTFEKLSSIDLIDKIVLTTDCEEIIYLARRYPKIEIVKREGNLASDKVTLDPVIFDAVKKVSFYENFDYIFTFQPTSPLLKKQTICKSIKKLIDENSDTLLTVTDDRHLAWSVDKNNRVFPLFEERLNRQYLPPRFKETGGIIACKSDLLTSGTRIGDSISLLKVSNEESIDIDTYDDFILASEIIRKVKIGIILIGNKYTGMGHIYRGLTLAHRLRYKPIFFVNENDDLAIKKLKESYYDFETYLNDEDLFRKLDVSGIQLVINDTLDTSENYVLGLKNNNRFVVTFEDLGDGADLSDMSINALYENSHSDENRFFGYRYFCLRDEFLFVNKDSLNESVKNVLITFGGTDPNNITDFCLEELKDEDLSIKVIVGPGYEYYQELVDKYSRYKNITILKFVKNMREHMESADIAITSNGRTVYELVAVRTPSIVFCQNEREIKHSFGYLTKTVSNMGLISDTSKKKFKTAFLNLKNDFLKRKKMFERMNNLKLERGTQRVIDMILQKYFEAKKNE